MIHHIPFTEMRSLLCVVLVASLVSMASGLTCVVTSSPFSASLSGSAASTSFSFQVPGFSPTNCPGSDGYKLDSVSLSALNGGHFTESHSVVLKNTQNIAKTPYLDGYVDVTLATSSTGTIFFHEAACLNSGGATVNLAGTTTSTVTIASNTYPSSTPFGTKTSSATCPATFNAITPAFDGTVDVQAPDTDGVSGFDSYYGASFTVDGTLLIGINYFNPSSGVIVQGGTVWNIAGGVQIQATFTYTTITPPPGASGDPQIVGFQGQKYQIHGIPDEHFNLVSASDYYVNSHFVYMANGVCNYNDTECFSHPGTYIDQLGVVTANGKGKLKLVAGSHEAGMVVYLNDQQLSAGGRVSLGTNDTYVQVLSRSRALVVLRDVSFTVANSDNFFNLNAELTRTDLLQAGAKFVRISTTDAAAADKVISQTYPEAQLHGLLGQTWRNIEYAHHRLYQGEPLDYQTPSLFDPEFVYSQYVL